MYYASILINNSPFQTNFTIYIINGQNQTQIGQYIKLNNTNQWNPCLPLPFDYTRSITITFHSTNWRDWYPYITCDYRSNTEYYKNTYLFDGGSSLILNYLNMNDYEIDNNTNYPIISTMRYYNASITINHGSFTNITSMIPAALFSSRSSIYVSNTSFINIMVSGIMFYGYHALISDYASRAFIFETTLFQNVSAQMILQLTYSDSDVK